MEKWTKSQKEAIESKGSILVTASAGTGKTAVLTEKVASLFAQGKADLSQIAVMTFSNAAAEEMKKRIGNKLIEMANDKSMPLNRRKFLYSQSKQLHTSNIKTIHAFCNDIIKKYYYIVGLNPDVKVGDNLEIAIMRRKAISEVLKEEYKNKEEDFKLLIEYFDNSEEIEDIFINAYEKIYNNINPEEWMKDAAEIYNVEDNKIPEFMKEKILSDFTKALEYYKDVLAEIGFCDDKKLDKALAVVEIDINIIKYFINEINASNVNVFESGRLDSFGATIRFPKDYTDIKDSRNKGKDIIDKYKKSNFSIPEQLTRIKQMYPIVKKFVNIIKKFDIVYSEMKKADNIIDFADMEKYANIILDNANISLMYKNTFRYVFVDEYQDTSPIQESIINKISGVNNLFCVGDQKQSIYRFRASEPALFLDRDKAYKEKILPGQVITLNNNFRSSKNILDCANDVFYNISKESNEIKYDKNEALVHSRDDDGNINPVKVIFVSDKFKAEYPSLTSKEIEVYNIVRQIEDEMNGEIYDQETKEFRPVKYSDITVLCRNLTGYAEIFTKIFTANKLPFIIEKSGGLLETTEILNLLNILELSDNFNNDLALISFIHEGFLGFTDDDLINIRKRDFNNSITQNVILMAKEDNDTGLKCNALISFINSVKDKEKYLSLVNTVNFIIEKINYIDYYAIQTNGKQRVANIKLFQQYISNYEEKHNDKIYGFLNYINELKDTNIIIDEAKVNYDENSIKITTIHKSKGLEYPIVILAFMNKAFSSIDKRTNVNVERSFGIGFKYFNVEKEEKGKTFIRTIIDDIIYEKNKEEEMRLLYVAMTRAKEKLIIQGTISSEINTNIDSASSMMDWIVTTIACKINGEANTLLGSWEVETPEPEEIKDYVLKELSPVDNDTFFNRYSLPFIAQEEETIELVDKNIPTTISASKIFIEEDNPFKEPKFKKKNISTDIGTATHNFLKFVDFHSDLSYFGLLEQKDEMVEKSLLKPEEAELIDYIKLEKFLNEDAVAKMITESDVIKREKSISIVENADEIGFYSNRTKNILVRCIIDLMFKKDGKWYLVDYKTDKINDENDDDELTRKILSHRPQIDLYLKAIKDILGITIEDSYIVFLDIGKSFRIFKY